MTPAESVFDFVGENIITGRKGGFYSQGQSALRETCEKYGADNLGLAATFPKLFLRVQIASSISGDNGHEDIRDER